MIDGFGFQKTPEKRFLGVFYVTGVKFKKNVYFCISKASVLNSRTEND